MTGPIEVGLQLVRLDGTRLAALGRRAEGAGLRSLWVAGAGENYLKAHELVACTTSATVGTCIVPLLLASPAMHAALARSLWRASGGRFVLGTGSQTRGQLRRALGRDVAHPVAEAGDTLRAVRSLLADVPVPLYYSGVGPLSLRTAGEIADGFLGHPLFTRSYLEEVVWPAVGAGLAGAGRSRHDFTMVALPMTLVAERPEEVPGLVRRAKRNLAWYFTTRSYGPFMDFHGWHSEREAIWELASRAGRDARRFDHAALEACVTDEMVETVCLIGTADQVRRAAAARYSGLADRLAVYPVVDPAADTAEAQRQEEEASLRAVTAFAGGVLGA